MGYATTRSVQRVAAAMGTLQAAPLVFEAARDIPQGGVLLALPALRARLEVLCAELGRAARWNTELAKLWIGEQTQGSQGGLAFYVDGHVRVCHAELTKLPRHYVARQRF